MTFKEQLAAVHRLVHTEDYKAIDMLFEDVIEELDTVQGCSSEVELFARQLAISKLKALRSRLAHLSRCASPDEIKEKSLHDYIRLHE